MKIWGFQTNELRVVCYELPFIAQVTTYFLHRK